MHEAGVVAHDEDLGARGHHVGDLVREHRGGGLGVLHGEGAAETTADLCVGQVDEGEALDGAQEAVGAVADLGDTQRVAGRVVGDRVGEVGAHVLEAQNVGDELGEVVGVFSDALGLLREMLVAHVLGDNLLLVARCTGAGAGRDDDGVPLAVEHGLESLDVVTGDLRGVFEVAGVCVHLSAADLVFREDDLVAEAFKQGHCGLGSLGEHDVCQAGGKESDAHWGILPRGCCPTQVMTGSEVPAAVFVQTTWERVIYPLFLAEKSLQLINENRPLIGCFRTFGARLSSG